MEHDYSESKDGNTRRRFYVTLHETFREYNLAMSGGQRVLPSQDSEDTQQQLSHARPHSIKVFLPAFYLWRHSHEEMYQALSRFTVLQAMGSWVRTWERGYIESTYTSFKDN